MMYIHNCNYDKDKIRTAIEMIDHLSLKINELNTGKNTFSIQNEVIDNINKEYQIFVTKKLGLKKYAQDFINKVCHQINELELPSLSHLLNSKYSTVVNDDLICPYCKIYVANNKLGLSVHKRNCKTKNNEIINDDPENLKSKSPKKISSTISSKKSPNHSSNDETSTEELINEIRNADNELINNLAKHVATTKKNKIKVKM